MGETAGAQPDDAAGDLPASLDVRRRRFEALALPHLDAAYNLARWLSRNPGDAEDIVQDACLRAFRFFDSFRGDNARPWLLAIVRRVWYDEWHRRASSAEVAELDDARDDLPPDGWETTGFDPEALAIRAQDAQRIHDALERLPAGYREVLILREMEDLSYREIATVIDAPVGTVMSRLARARGRLARLLGAHSGQAAHLAAAPPCTPLHGVADGAEGAHGADGKAGGSHAQPRCRATTPAAETGPAHGVEAHCGESRRGEARDEL
jgi:RNA polymerase sigma-70 factor (ECF subfamily)